MKLREWERFDDLVNDAMIRLLDAFIRGGTREMRLELYTILPAYARWIQDKKLRASNGSSPTDSGSENG